MDKIALSYFLTTKERLAVHCKTLIEVKKLFYAIDIFETSKGKYEFLFEHESMKTLPYIIYNYWNEYKENVCFENHRKIVGNKKDFRIGTIFFCDWVSVIKIYEFEEIDLEN